MGGKNRHFERRLFQISQTGFFAGRLHGWETGGSMAEFFSTNSVRQSERFAYWREAVCDSYVMLDCQSENEASFSGEIVLDRLSSLSVSFVTGSQQVVRRRRRDIGRAADHSFLISMQLQKPGIVTQGGREASLRPTDFALYSSTDRYRLELPDGFRQLVVQVPREAMLARLPQADDLTGIAVQGDTPLGSIVHDSVTRLVSAMDRSNVVVRGCVQDSIIDLFVTGLASLTETRFELSRPEQLLLLRAHASISTNLHDPTFDRHSLAAELGVSVRRLSEIFQADGRTVAATIREMRLARVCNDLRDARNQRRSIADIAHRWGFSNQQSFIRIFRDAYGQSPREYRAGS